MAQAFGLETWRLQEGFIMIPQTFFASLFILGFTAAAHANMLTNGDLEKDPATPLNPYNLVNLSPTLNNTALPGWTITAGTVDIVPNTYWQASEGAYSVDLVGTPGIGSIAQSVTTVPNAGYGLSFDLTANPEAGPFNETATTKILRIQALASNGTTVLASQDYSLTAGTRTLLNMQWTTNTFTFTALDATTTLQLSALTPLNLPSGATASTIFTGPVIDNLDLLTSGNVPEPNSLALLLLGTVPLLLPRRPRAPIYPDSI
jgi:choice-of-anchor C domain-containing protein